MRRIFSIIALSILWLLMVAGFFIAEQYIARPRVERGDIESLERYLDEELQDAAKNQELGSGALILMHNGQIALVRCLGAASESIPPPNVDKTLYLLSSVSKAVTTWGLLKLVDDGRIGLDEPVLSHLKRWRFPGSDARAGKVTIRHLLTHTSGLVDGFGYSGFLLHEEKQTPEESLNFPKDANHGEPHPAIISSEPGTSFSYSSSGYTVLQMLVEDITGLSFQKYMTEEVLLPLAMKSSSYDIEDIIAQGRRSDLAPNYDVHLQIHPHRKYTMMAGGSLRVTASDMSKFLQAYYHQVLLSGTLVKEMIQPQPLASGIWAIGHEVYGENNSGSFIIGHGGGAFPRTGASFRVNPSTGNGIAVMMTGGSEMIDPYMNAWQYWETGTMKFDIWSVVHKRKWHVLLVYVIGLAAILVWRTLR